MENFTGANVQTISHKKQSDVVIRKVLSDYQTVTVAADTTLEVGTLLVTSDAVNYAVADEAAEPNAILCEPISETGKAEVLLVGVVREKYLEGLVTAHKIHLFNNKIILK